MAARSEAGTGAGLVPGRARGRQKGWGAPGRDRDLQIGPPAPTPARLGNTSATGSLTGLPLQRSPEFGPETDLDALIDLVQQQQADPMRAQAAASPDSDDHAENASGESASPLDALDERLAAALSAPTRGASANDACSQSMEF